MSALKRHAEIEANAINVSVENGDKVVLEGAVGTWGERRAVEDAAWSAPGVASVEDRLTMTGGAHSYSLPDELEPDLGSHSGVLEWLETWRKRRSFLGRRQVFVAIAAWAGIDADWRF